MKTRLFLMAMASVALASCVSEDVADVKQKEEKKQKIAFSSPLAYTNSTRANVPGEINNPYPIGESFTIYATEYTQNAYGGWNGSTVEFNAKEVKYDSSVDGWAPKTAVGGYYYWPDGEVMAFAACSPHELGTGLGTKEYGADGLTITDFKVQDNAKDQYDLLFSKRIYDKKASDMVKVEGQYSGIQLTFQHALSSIHFSIVNETLLATDPSQRSEIILKSIEVKDVCNKGTFKENLDEGTSGNYNFNYDRDVNGNVSPQWTGQSLDGTISYSAFTVGLTDLNFPSVQQYVSKYIERLEDENPGNEGTYGEAIPLLMLPQSLSNNAKIVVTYRIQDHDEDSKKEIIIKDIKDENGVALSPEWKIGTKYTYRLVYSLNTSMKDRIYFAPSTDDWNDGGIIVVNL